MHWHPAKGVLRRGNPPPPAQPPSLLPPQAVHPQRPPLRALRTSLHALELSAFLASDPEEPGVWKFKQARCYTYLCLCIKRTLA